MDHNGDASAVPGRPSFRRDVNAQVAGDGTGNGVIVQFSHGLLLPGEALLTADWKKSIVFSAKTGASTNFW